MNVEYIPPAKPQRPQLPSLPPQMQVSLPNVYVAPIDTSKGFFGLLAEGFKTVRIERITDSQLKASNNMLAMARNTAEAMKLHMTFAAEVQMVFVRLDHEKTMYGYAEKRAEKENENISFLGIEMQLKNQILMHQSTEAEISAKTAALEFEARRRAMEDM